jgi:hemerythrin-like domain-containing protein
VRRSDALSGLSRDHHHTLTMAQRLRRATPGEAPATAAALLDFWRRAERRHLELEEDILVPALERHGLAEHPAVARMLVEHALIRRQVEEIASGASGTEQLRALGKKLAEHVRHEERAVFPLAEQRLGAKALAELGAALTAPERDGRGSGAAAGT